MFCPFFKLVFACNGKCCNFTKILALNFNKNGKKKKNGSSKLEDE